MNDQTYELILLPGVPAVAALAPGKVTIPPSFKCLEAIAAEMQELHTL